MHSEIMVVVLCVCLCVLCVCLSLMGDILQLKIYYLAESAILFYNFESRVCSSVLSFVPDMLT